VRFGVFEVDLRAEELRKQGMKVRLRGHPFDILAMLLERPGELVTREELRDRLWPADSFVDFDHGLNAAVNRLREAIGDSADNPRFVETVPRRGYRFIAPTFVVAERLPIPPVPETPSLPRFLPRPSLPPRPYWRPWAGWVLAACAVSAAIVWQRPWDRTTPLRGAVTRIAVLPFENKSGDSTQEYLVDGFTDALIGNLAKVGSLRVVSHASTMAYKRSAKPLPQIGRELNVDALVKGSSIRAGTRVRLSAWLVDAESERPLWAETYERSISEVLSLQGEVARAVVHGARVSVTPQEEAYLVRAKPVDPGAYETWLRGRFLRETLPDDALRRGVAAFEEAVRRDPWFAHAYASLAECYWRMGTPGLEIASRSETAPKAKAAALKALELDPQLAPAEAILAMIETEYEWDSKAGESRMRRVLIRNPSLSDIRLSYSAYLSGQGRTDEALVEAQTALDLDPLSIITGQTLGARLLDAAQYDRSSLQLQKTLELSPTAFGARLALAQCHWRRHDWKRAIPEAERALADSETNLWAVAWLGYAYGASGDRDRGRSTLTYLDALSSERHVPAFYRAMVHAGLDENDEAIAALEAAVFERSGWIALLETVRELDPLRSDPRYAALVRRVGLR
jgi:TolB-like protein/DNA-binding winged helix-turn-helix (wHTH) protein/Tfp pilus assembly protein PilF